MAAFSACRRCSTVLAAVIEMPRASFSACRPSCCATSELSLSFRCFRSLRADSRFEMRLHSEGFEACGQLGEAQDIVSCKNVADMRPRYACNVARDCVSVQIPRVNRSRDI